MRSTWFLFVVAAVLSSDWHTVTAATAPPNVVLIISDDQVWGDYGFMGHLHIKSPHLDRLASESLVFSRGYVPSSLCCPSLATIITGLYPHQHHITGNDPTMPLLLEIGYLARCSFTMNSTSMTRVPI